MDTTGLLLAVVIHAANIQDRDGARLVLAKLLGRFPRLQVIWADAAYAGRLVAWAWATGGWLLKVVRRNPDSHQFEVLPRRWVVERTLAWLSLSIARVIDPAIYTVIDPPWGMVI